MKRLFALAVVLCAVILGLPAKSGACIDCSSLGMCQVGSRCWDGSTCQAPQGQCCGTCPMEP
jgi:hypothetical protein